MTGAETLALFGTLGTLALVIGGIIVRDRQVHKAIKEGDDQLHERVNRVRDEYVKRVDNDASMGRIDQTLQEIRSEQRELYRTIVQHFAGKKDGQ